MAWTSPVTNRAESDVINKTAKGYFNVADWTRIRDNSAFIMTFLNFALGTSLTPAGISAPSTATVPTNVYVNGMIQDIAIVYIAAGFLTANAPRYDWPGNGPAAPSWVDANQWEQALLDVYNKVHLSSDGFAYCGTANCGMDFVDQNGFIILYV
jgi:hypothetical protein